MTAVVLFLCCVFATLSLLIGGVTFSIIPKDMTFYSMMKSIDWDFSTLLALDTAALQFYILMFIDYLFGFFKIT
jgi:hypothetical protein